MEIRLKDYQKSYKKKVIFEKQNTSFRINDIALVIGESGAGKTTLCNCIYGIDQQYKGSIDILNDSDSKTAFMPQSNKLIDYMTVEENILSFTEVGFDNKLDELLKELGIIELKNRNVNELSGGQKQRVNLARCLINEPNLCILDEPTGSLDNITTNSIIELIKEINQSYNTKFLIITHDIRLIDKFSDYILIEKKQIIANTIINSEQFINVNRIKQVFSNKNLFKNSRKRNKKSLLFSGSIMSFFTLIFCILSLLMLSTNNDFIEAVNSFFGENGGEIRSTSTIGPEETGCQMVGDYEVCDLHGSLTIPGYSYFSQEELDYISAYEGIEQITYVYDVAPNSNIKVTYNGTGIATRPYSQAELYQEATGDMVLEEAKQTMQFSQLIAPVEYLKNYGTWSVPKEFWDVMYGEVHELAQNEIVLPYSYAKVVAYEQGVEVEELVGSTITFEDYNTVSVDVVNDEVVPEREYSTIDYTVAWIYDDVEGAYIYLPYVEDQSLYTTDLDAMFMDLFYFYEGNDEALEWKMQFEYDMLLETYEKMLQDPNMTKSNLAYHEALLKINSDLELKKASIQTGVREVKYTLKPGYSQEDFATYLEAGPMPLSNRDVNNAENFLSVDSYNETEDRIMKIIFYGTVLMMILFFLQKLYFKDIYKELQLAKLLGFNKKERFKVLFKFYLLLLLGTIILVIPISAIVMILINFLVTPVYLNIMSFVIIAILITIFSSISFAINYVLVLSQDPKKELHD